MEYNTKSISSCFSIKSFSFLYPNASNEETTQKNSSKALTKINLDIKRGDFVIFYGKSGCGKTTLLRHLKPAIAPHGKKQGEISFLQKSISKVSARDLASKIGFVFQNPINQIVTDKVWHELAFGLESLGEESEKIRLKVAEMASFFGIQDWFYKKIVELSGGQKQILSLASIMAMQPEVLILDEPTSQLDPIAASEFLDLVKKINIELGITVLITEHRLKNVFPICDKVVVMDNGKILSVNTPQKTADFLKKNRKDLFIGLPVPVQIWGNLEKQNKKCPLTIKESRKWLKEIIATNSALTRKPNEPNEITQNKQDISSKKNLAVIASKVWYKYERNDSSVIKGLDYKCEFGKVNAILGGNGSGKSTTLALIAGMYKPYRGSIKLDGINVKKISKNQIGSGLIGFLPQDPTLLFVEKTVKDDLWEVLSNKQNDSKAQECIDTVIKQCRLENLINKHPYDISVGEQQRLAIAKILLLNPKIILCDEPTKGLDAQYKEEFANILKEKAKNGACVILVSHDIEFCANFSETCSLLFNGSIITSQKTKQFFNGNNFYTTCANLMARGIFNDVTTQNDLLKCIKESLK